MKYLLLLLLSVSSVSSYAQSQSGEPELKQYFFVLLTKGPHRDQDSAAAARIQEAHLSNISRLSKEGKIDLAGPFADDTDWRGIFVFNVATKEEVEKILQTDEAIRSGRLSYVIHPWLTKKGSVLN
jgi:uncharacterized protein YciI